MELCKFGRSVVQVRLRGGPFDFWGGGGGGFEENVPEQSIYFFA